MQTGHRQQKNASSQASAAGRRADVRQDSAHQSLLSSKLTPTLNIQPKLSIGQAGDKHEQEADRVADQVVSQPLQRTPSLDQPVTVKPQLQRPPAITPMIQQQAEETAREENQFQEEEQLVQGTGLQFQEESVSEGEETQAKVRLRADDGALQPKAMPIATTGSGTLSGRPATRAPPVFLQNRGGNAARAPPLQLKCTAVQTKTIQLVSTPLPLQSSEQSDLSMAPFQEDAEVRPGLIQCRGPPIQAWTEASESRLDRELRQSRGGGLPLPEKTRIRMESGIGADFSNVRVHTDANAAQMNKMLGSQAFATGNNIFFGAGKYDPESLDGQRLLAHELTHTVQQNASPRLQLSSVARPRAPPVQQSTAYDLQGGFIGDRLNEYARHVPGWELFTVIIGYNPLTEQDVSRTPQNFLRGFMGLVPGGTALYDKLNENSLIDDAFSWLSSQLSDLDLSWSRLRNAIDAAWEDMDFIRWDPFAYNLRVLKRHMLPIWNDVKTFAGRVIDKTVELVRTTMLTPLVNFIKERTRAYPLLCVILGSDPITGEQVDRSLYNIVSAFLMLTESGEEYLNKLNESGKLQELSDWLDAEIEKLDVSVETVTNAFSEAWELLNLNAVLHPIDTFTRLYNIFAGPVTRLFNFVVAVAMKVLGLIKDWLLGLLKEYANDIPGYPLLCVILGSDPLTGEEVPRTAENFIMGFLSFVPEGQEKFRNLQESGAIDKAFAWLEEAIGQLGLIGEALMNAFTQIWETFTINDLTDPIGAFERVVEIFTEPVRMIIDFALEVGMKILEFIFEGVLGPTGARVLAILKRARSTFTKIINDPVAFVGNLIEAVKKGFRQFAGNILRHLQAGLIGWLTGTLGGAGITLPERFDFQGILSLVMQVLGITWQRVRQKLVRRLGERTVSILETSFEVVRILVTEGPAGLWDRLVEHLGNLRDTVIDGIKNFIITRIVTAAVTRIATMLNPAGAVIQAIIAIYNTIMFFIERIEQIIDLVEAVVNSIANIADGKLDDAANYVEQSMARTIPVIISFLARLIGLGNVSGAIQNILRRVHRAVDRAIDRVIAWIARQARRLIRAGRGAVAAIAGWFRRRVPFRSSDGRNHSLYFEGSDRNPQLKARSTPTLITDIIRIGRFDGRALSDGEKSRLRTEHQALRRATTATSQGDVNEDVVQRHLLAIKTVLGAGGSDMYHPAGTREDPVWINWYKRESDYPQVLGASPTEGFEVSVRRSQRRSDVIIIERRVDPANFLGERRPLTLIAREGARRANFLTPAELDALGAQRNDEGVRPLPNSSENARNYGRPTEGVFEIDHVKDLNLGGRDAYNNLWPLSSSGNRAGNATQNQQVVTRIEQDPQSRQWSPVMLSLSNSFFTTKHVTAVASNVQSAQQRAMRTLGNAGRANKSFAGNGSDPFPIAWLKRRSDYPSYRPANSNRSYRIGQPAPVTVNQSGNPRRGTHWLNVNSANIDPINSRGSWAISRNQTRTKQIRVGTSITRQYREARNPNPNQTSPPQVRRGQQELTRLDLSSYLEADHVRDLNFGGHDARDNMWPLPANKNNAANAVNQQMVAHKQGDATAVKSLRQARNDAGGTLHVRIAQVLGIPSSQNAHGTSSERPAGHAELLRMAGAQRKAWTSGTTDRYEQEADRVADQVAFGNRHSVSTLVDRISTAGTGTNARPQMRQQQAKAEGAASSLDLPSGGGAPMDSGVRAEMEGSFGRDFSNVRIHDDSKSHEMSSSIGARAFTKDSDIYFGQGQYNPSTTSGKHLLAHELTHTVQQGSIIRRKPVETAAATAPSAATAPQAHQDPLVLGGAPMSGLEPPVVGEIQSPTVVEQQAEAEAGIKKDKKALDPGERGAVKGGKARPGPAGDGKEKAVEKKKETEERPSAEQQPVPAPKPLKGGSSDGMLNDFMTSTASKIAASYPTLGAGVSETLKAEKKQEADSAPKLVAKAGKGKVKARAPPAEARGAQKAAIEEKEPKPVIQQKIPEHKNLARPVNNARNNKALDQSSAGSWISWFKDRVRSFMSGIRTKDDGVNTSAGKPPKTELKGDADPKRADRQRKDGDRQTGTEKDKVSAQIKANPGKKRIQPAPVDETNEVKIEAAVPEVETGKQDDMADYVNMPLPESVRGKADQDMSPLLEKSLAKPKADVKKASDKRNSDKQAEVSKAKAEVDKLNQKADQDQKNTIDSSRNDVASEQKKGLDEADQQIKKYRKEADKEQTTLRDSVKKRVREDEKKAAAKLQKAEEDAKKEKKKKEAEAAVKKKELKREQKKKSWWDRVKDVVKSVVKAITKAIDGIFNALRKAVKFIIDTAKKAALALIELGRKFVVGLLNTFRKFLKSLVSNLIGKIFPELARKINKAIDNAVDKAIKGVNKVANALKKGVEALANALGKLLDKILSVFQTALKAAVQIVGAVMTGDFAEAAKIAFYAACDILGINPKSVINFIEKAGESLGKIFKSPGTFFNNVAKGVKKGIDQFVANIKQHLLNGLIAWLTGAMGDVQITLPKKFDIKGIFSLVTQILGLTYDNIRAKVVKKLGPKGEKIVSTLEKTFAFVKDLVTKGPIALWERVKKGLSNLKDKVMEGIRNAVIEKVVKAGVVWLISMLNPASALVKAIKMLYDLVMFFVERWDQIVAFAKSIWNSVNALANGQIGAAANAVEQALARSIPVILGLLASLLSLGGIGKSVQKVIREIRKPIDKAVNKVVTWIVDKGRSMINRLAGRKDPAAKQALDPSKMTPDQKKAAAKQELEQWIRGGDRQGGLIKAKLPELKQKYKLSDVRLEMTAQGPRIGYYASAGEFTYFFEGREMRNIKSTTSAGFKSVNSAAGVVTPKGVITQKYPGQIADDAFRCGSASLDRPSSVIAEQTGVGSSVNRGGSSVQGNAGYVGLDEEQIMAGHRNTSYRGGHLIAYVILGENSNRGYNLAPQVNRFNAPAYFKIFEEVAMKTPTTVEITVEVGYAMHSYQVDQKTLVDRGILTRIDLNKDWTVSLAKRIPNTWNATIVAKQGSLVEGGVAAATDTATQGRVVTSEAAFNALKVDGDGDTEKVQKWNSFKMLITEGGQRNSDASITTGGAGRTRLSIRAEQLDFSAPLVRPRPTFPAPQAGQAKLDVGGQDNSYEQEADTLARKIVRNTSSVNHTITPFQRSGFQFGAVSESIGSKNPSIEGQLWTETSKGIPLPASVRLSMEALIGADLGSVRVHTDVFAAKMSREMGAQAFTHRNHIYFNQGQYAPETSKGKHLLAHEITHVVQQDSRIRRRPEENVPVQTTMTLSATEKNEDKEPLVPGAAPMPGRNAKAELKRFRNERDAKKTELKRFRKTEERDLLIWKLAHDSGLTKLFAALSDKKQVRAQVSQAEKILYAFSKLISDLKKVDPSIALIGFLETRYQLITNLIAEYGSKYADQPGYQGDRRLSNQGLLLRERVLAFRNPAN